MNEYLQEQTSNIFIILVCIFSGSLVIASILASKIINVAGISVPAGVLAYCITFICTDVISEIWGKDTAKKVVLAGFATLLLVMLLIQLALYWPAASYWQQQASFAKVLSTTPRIIIASIFAYLVSQFHDVWAFHFWKKLTKGKFLWLRNNLSTAVSQFIDSSIFILIAFYGNLPVLALIFGQWAVKMLIALLDTAVVYALIWSIRRKSPDLAYK